MLLIKMQKTKCSHTYYYHNLTFNAISLKTHRILKIVYKTFFAANFIRNHLFYMENVVHTSRPWEKLFGFWIPFSWKTSRAVTIFYKNFFEENFIRKNLFSILNFFRCCVVEKNANNTKCFFSHLPVNYSALNAIFLKTSRVFKISFKNFLKKIW